jgi:hypothetical protein
MSLLDTPPAFSTFSAPVVYGPPSFPSAAFESTAFYTDDPDTNTVITANRPGFQVNVGRMMNR